MTTHRRLAAVAAALATLGTTLGVLGWLAIGFMPIRDAVGGPFVPWSQTPERSALGPSWPMFGASPARARYAASELRPPFRVLYAIPGGGGLVEMPPAVSQGRVVFGTHKGIVIAARLRDGARLWVTRLDKCIASSPAVRAGVVYVGWSSRAPCRRRKEQRGGVVALSLATGKVIWRFGTGNVEASPAVVGRTLFFSSFRTRRDSRVYAMSLGPRRRMLWSYPIASKIASSPALVGGTLFVSAYNRRLYAFDAHAGRLLWETSAFSDASEVRLLLGVRSLVKRGSWTEGGYYATPAVAYQRVFLGTIDGVFSAFDARTGLPRWSRRLDGSTYGSAAVWKATVFVGTTSGDFYALGARDGEERWKVELEGKILGSPTVTNGRVYIATSARETFVLDARTGELEWRFPDGRYSPLVVAGERALLVGKGRVYGLVNGDRVTGWRAS